MREQLKGKGWAGHGFDERSEERHGLGPGRTALVRRVVPAPQARQGQHRGTHQAKACAVRQGGHKTFNADTKVDTANVDRRDMQYLYHDGSGFVFMDTSTYDQLTIADETVGDAKNYLLEGQVATVAIHDGTPLYLELPASVELVVTYTEPGLQGDRSTGGTKPATVETGLQIQVPLFLTTGEKVKVDTRSGEYLSRVGS